MTLENEEILKEIPAADWPSLKLIFQKNWPLEIYAFYVIQNYIDWTINNSGIECKIYSPYGKLDGGTIIIEAAMSTLPTIYMFTMERKSDLLKKVLLETKKIDWRKGHFIYGVHSEYWPHVAESLRAIGLQSEYQYFSHYYWISINSALQFDIECPDNVYVSPLRTEDIERIDSIWPHRYCGSTDFLHQIITYNGGLGIYEKTTDALCSWIFKNQLLGLGILQTVDEHKRKGYAKILIKALSKKMAMEDKIDIHTCIVSTNSISQSLFLSLGFKRIDRIVFEKILKP